MIANRIYEWAQTQPTKTAVISNDQMVSYADFARAIEAARSFFERQGLVAGQTAIVIGSTILDAWVFIMALRAQGVTTVCDQSLDQAQTLNLRNVACLVVSQGNEQASRLSGTPLGGINVIAVPRGIFAGIRTSELPAYPPHAPPFGGHILLTSGTTGAYKKILLEGKYEDRRNIARGNVYPLHKNMSYYAGNFGLWASTGFRMPSATWHAGGCVIFDARDDALSRFFHHPVDLAILTPLLLRHLIQSLGPAPADDKCEVLVGAGFLPIELAKEAACRVTKKLGISYGCTELSTPSLISRARAEDDMYWLAPTANRSIRIIDEDGNECPPDREGELCIELLDIDCKSYLDDDAASAKMFRDGFFCPGDLAVRRADGRVRILGRTSDVLNVRGQKIAVAPIELEIQRSSGVDEVCLFSGLSETGEEELVVAMQSERALPKLELEQIAREFPLFERVRFAFFKKFPRTATGTRKVQRTVLRKLVFPEHRR
jgi:acyl-coenzyme A synthetase/AMP-(fatty) acid ligase